MLQERKRISELLDGFDAEMKTRGLAVTTRLRRLSCITPLVAFHEERGAEWLDGALIAEFLSVSRERFADSEKYMRYFTAIRRSVEQFIAYARGDDIVWNNPMKGSTYNLTPEFQHIADSYINSGDMHPNTRNDARWVVHKYFSWLAEQGYENLNSVGAHQLQKFLLSCTQKMSFNSLRNVSLHLKKLYAYLYGTGQSASEFRELLSFKVNRETKVFRPMPKGDLARVISAIDRATIAGKREYAAMLLGAVLGLRACDVAALKLADIDWVNGRINFVQSKTGNPATLPLTEDVGEALRDYILYGRRNTGDHRVFQSLRAPYGALASAVTVGEIYDKCCKRAGLDDGKRFHTLRRTLATAMVTNGVDISNVAQTLCDKDVDSVKRYISLDSNHLKICALSFAGIAPIGGDVL